MCVYVFMCVYALARVRVCVCVCVCVCVLLTFPPKLHGSQSTGGMLTKYRIKPEGNQYLCRFNCK